MIGSSKRGESFPHPIEKEAVLMLDSEIENNSSEQKSESEYGYVGEFAKESIYSDAH